MAILAFPFISFLLRWRWSHSFHCTINIIVRGIWNKWDIPSDDAFCYVRIIIVIIIIQNAYPKKKKIWVNTHDGQCKKRGALMHTINWIRFQRQLIIFTYTHSLTMLLISFLQWLSLSSSHCQCSEFSPHFHFHFSSFLYLYTHLQE